jgi:hypothetical protein
MNRIFNFPVAQAGLTQRPDVLVSDFYWTQGQLFEEAKEGAEFVVDGRRAPVGLDRFNNIGAEFMGRDRAMRDCSSRALIEAGSEGSEQLSLSGTPG